MTAQIRAKPLIASIALAMGGGFLSNRLSGDVKGIYQTLNLPWFAPPDWVFAVVWPVLYLLIAAAYYLVMESPKGEARTQAMTFYLVQLFLNFLWSPLFFRWGAYAWAFRLLCTIFLLALATIICFALLDRRTLWLMTPYLVWLVFAMLLNKSIAVLN